MEDAPTLDLSKTYIFDGDEYILTGRVAERSPDAPPPRPRRSKRHSNVAPTAMDMMVEIQPRPKGRSIIGVPSEARWVKFGQLYAIVDVLQEDDEEED